MFGEGAVVDCTATLVVRGDRLFYPSNKSLEQDERNKGKKNVGKKGAVTWGAGTTTGQSVMSNTHALPKGKKHSVVTSVPADLQVVQCNNLNHAELRTTKEMNAKQIEDALKAVELSDLYDTRESVVQLARVRPLHRVQAPEVPDGAAKGAGAKSQTTVQRLVASASEGPKDDRVFQNTTLVAHTMVGGKIKKMSAVDFSKDFAATSEGLAITAHGNINVVGDYSGAQIADKLTDKAKGLQEGTHDIHFQSCYAAVEGAKNPTDTPTSVIGTVKAALDQRGKEAGWTRAPLVSGSYGPQIVVRIPKDMGKGFDIMKAVIDPKFVPYASAIQGVLTKVIADVKDKIVLNFGGEGTDFIKQAEQDEEEVRQLKDVFIHLVSGEPSKIDGKLLAQLKTEWKSQGKPERVGKAIFETGVDLRAKTETVTI